jgi:hypothetical protein
MAREPLRQPAEQSLLSTAVALHQQVKSAFDAMMAPVHDPGGKTGFDAFDTVYGRTEYLKQRSADLPGGVYRCVDVDARLRRVTMTGLEVMLQSGHVVPLTHPSLDQATDLQLQDYVTAARHFLEGDGALLADLVQASLGVPPTPQPRPTIVTGELHW